MDRLIGISEAAKMLGVSVTTLRRWDASGKLRAERTPSGHRRYRFSQVASFNPQGVEAERGNLPALAYARVSPSEGRRALSRQEKALGMYCAAHGWGCVHVSDVGDGVDGSKPGLRELLGAVVAGEVSRVVVTRKDRLLRLGSELVFAVCEAAGVEVVVMNQGDAPDCDEEVAADVLALAEEFGARLYGHRAGAASGLLEKLREAASSASGCPGRGPEEGEGHEPQP